MAEHTRIPHYHHSLQQAVISDWQQLTPLIVLWYLVIRIFSLSSYILVILAKGRILPYLGKYWVVISEMMAICWPLDAKI